MTIEKMRADLIVLHTKHAKLIIEQQKIRQELVDAVKLLERMSKFTGHIPSIIYDFNRLLIRVGNMTTAEQERIEEIQAELHDKSAAKGFQKAAERGECYKHNRAQAVDILMELRDSNLWKNIEEVNNAIDECIELLS